MPERPRAQICHVSTGRVRLRVPERRRDDAYFARVGQRVASWPGVERVEVNPVTAGILLHGAAGADELVSRARADDLFELEGLRPDPTPVPLAESLRGSVRRIDQRLRQLTGGSGDLRSLVVVALLAGAFAQLVRGNVAAPAATLLWYAGEALGLWRDDPEAVSPAPEPGPS
jgi:hypothetical protein